MFLLIRLNNKAVNLGSPLPDKIASCVIESMRGTLIPTEQVPMVKRWLNTLVDNLDCEYVAFNGVLVSRIDIKKLKE